MNKLSLDCKILLGRGLSDTDRISWPSIWVKKSPRVSQIWSVLFQVHTVTLNVAKSG